MNHGKYSLIQSLLAAATLGSAVAVSAQNQIPLARDRNSPPNPGADSAQVAPVNTPAVADSRIARRDRVFLERAAKAGMKEVSISESALPNLTTPSARDFAQRVSQEHRKVQEELAALAARKGVTLPAESDYHADRWGSRVKNVDADYIRQMTEDHKDSVELFEKATRSEDPDIAAFAQRTLPTLQHHLSMLQNGEVRPQPLSGR